MAATWRDERKASELWLRSSLLAHYINQIGYLCNERVAEDQEMFAAPEWVAEHGARLQVDVPALIAVHPIRAAVKGEAWDVADRLWGEIADASPGQNLACRSYPNVFYANGRHLRYLNALS
jgi:hypothetical protein